MSEYDILQLIPQEKKNFVNYKYAKLRLLNASYKQCFELDCPGVSKI